jgi:hypothetical protein
MERDIDHILLGEVTVPSIGDGGRSGCIPSSSCIGSCALLAAWALQREFIRQGGKGHADAGAAYQFVWFGWKPGEH